jgi:hypothetical protein
MSGENRVSANSGKNDHEQNPQGKISPELVRRVAELVYRMLRHDLQLERERARISSNGRTGGFRG